MTLIQFTENHEDLSTDQGYQFKFFCDRCRNGYMSSFQASALGTCLLSAGRRKRLWRRLRFGRGKRLRNPASRRRQGPRRCAEGGGRGGALAVPPVQAVRQVGLPGELLERAARPVQRLRARRPDGACVGPGGGDGRADQRRRPQARSHQRPLDMAGTASRPLSCRAKARKVGKSVRGATLVP